MALREEPGQTNREPMPDENLYERINGWVQEAMVKCEVANFEWEWHQATALCDRYGCQLGTPDCPRCGR